MSAMTVAGSPGNCKWPWHCWREWPDHSHAGIGGWRQSRRWTQSV